MSFSELCLTRRYIREGLPPSDPSHGNGPLCGFLAIAAQSQGTIFLARYWGNPGHITDTIYDAEHGLSLSLTSVVEYSVDQSSGLDVDHAPWSDARSMLLSVLDYHLRHTGCANLLCASLKTSSNEVIALLEQRLKKFSEELYNQYLHILLIVTNRKGAPEHPSSLVQLTDPDWELLATTLLAAKHEPVKPSEYRIPRKLATGSGRTATQ